LTINKITHARLEELFIILKNRLGSALTRQNLPCGIVLTGGASRTPLIQDLAEVTLDIPVSIGQSPDWVRHGELQEAEYSTVLGLLYNALHDQREAGRNQGDSGQKRWIKKMTGLFS
jgi:cell division ATPase FtsA